MDQGLKEVKKKCIECLKSVQTPKFAKKIINWEPSSGRSQENEML